MLAVVVSLVLPGATAIAALPDAETYKFVTSRYKLYIENTRGGCTYLANPQTLSRQGERRSISVLLTRGQDGGSACNGVFEFQQLQVNCNNQQIYYDEQLPGSEAPRWFSHPVVAQTVCLL